MTVIVIAVLFLIAATRISGSAVSSDAAVSERAEFAEAPHAHTAVGSPGAGPSARSETCRSARNGLRWYRAKQRAWSQLHPHASWPRGRQPRNCADARYLARVARIRAHVSRVTYERWVDTHGATINRLERGMRGTPMMGTGAILERWGRRYGVSPYFMVAVAATESSIGVAACSNNRRNVWGLASCVNSWPVPYFNTWDAAISFYAHFLSSRWPGHSTPYSFRGYAACSDCWARKVSYWMNALFGVPAVTRYP